ncbi:hypothetical protein N868_06920, partial [Cellulomonas carbonis T26]
MRNLLTHSAAVRTARPRRARALTVLVTAAVGLAGVLVPTAASAATTQSRDSFSRTTSSGWGSADAGGAWTGSGGLAVRSGAGRQALARPASGAQAVLAGHASTSTDLRVRTSLDKAPRGGAVFLSVLGRRVGTSGDYRARLKVQPSGATALVVSRGESDLDSTSLGFSVGGSTSVNVRLQVVGTSPTTLRAKAWKAGSSEPSSWQVSATDSTAALQQSGAVGIASYLSSSATNAPVTARWDDLSAVPLTTSASSATAPAPAPAPAPEPAPAPAPAVVKPDASNT